MIATYYRHALDNVVTQDAENHLLLTCVAWVTLKIKQHQLQVHQKALNVKSGAEISGCESASCASVGEVIASNQTSAPFSVSNLTKNSRSGPRRLAELPWHLWLYRSILCSRHMTLAG